MTDFPQAIVPVDHVEPVPRRIRATLGGAVVLEYDPDASAEESLLRTIDERLGYANPDAR